MAENDLGEVLGESWDRMEAEERNKLVDLKRRTLVFCDEAIESLREKIGAYEALPEPREKRVQDDLRTCREYLETTVDYREMTRLWKPNGEEA